MTVVSGGCSPELVSGMIIPASWKESHGTKHMRIKAHLPPQLPASCQEAPTDLHQGPRLLGPQTTPPLVQAPDKCPATSGMGAGPSLPLTPYAPAGARGPGPPGGQSVAVPSKPPGGHGSQKDPA